MDSPGHVTQLFLERVPADVAKIPNELYMQSVVTAMVTIWHCFYCTALFIKHDVSETLNLQKWTMELEFAAPRINFKISVTAILRRAQLHSFKRFSKFAFP